VTDDLIDVPRRHRARRGDGELLREEIIAAATRLLVEKGDQEAVSIRAIADAVGVTPPSIYLHFADKDELFLEVCNDRFRELDRRMVALGETATDPVDGLHKRGEAYIRFGLENPEEYRILFIDHPKSASAEQVKDWAAFEHMVEAVQRCIDAGDIAAGDPMVITIGLWAAVHGITSLMISMPEFPWPPVDTMIDHVLSTCVYGLRG
jgi:AcrR family transcriptional regulator